MPDKRLIRMSDLEERRHDYLWEDRIGRGELTILEGPPGSGKSCLTYDLAGRVTTGREMPLCTRRREPAGVVLLQGEDGLANDVKPNLRAAGADLDKVIAYNRTADAGHPFTLPGDITVLKDAITEVAARLVVIDPITAFFSASVNHDQSVRTVLSPLAELADDRNVAILLVRHLTKSGRGSALYRGAGSIGIVGAARSALVVGDDPASTNKFHHILAQFKGNRSSASSISFRTEPYGNRAIRVQWLEESRLSADDIIVAGSKLERTALQEATDVLQEILLHGPVAAKRVIKLAADAGIAKRTLDRAKARLAVRSRKIGSGPDAMWVWETRDGTDRLANRLFSPPTSPRPTRDIVRPTRNRDNERPNDDESRALREFLRPRRDIVRRRRNGDDDHPTDGEQQPQ